MFIFMTTASRAAARAAGVIDMRRRREPTLADAAFLGLALVWAGMLVGVSFVATPVKFAAPGLSLAVALEVGHVTFRLFSRIEWALAAGLLLASAWTARRRLPVLAGLLAALVALQAVWLLPVLDARVAAVVAGTPLPPTSHHTYYAVAEGAKLLLLLAAAWPGLRFVAAGGRTSPGAF